MEFSRIKIRENFSRNFLTKISGVQFSPKMAKIGALPVQFGPRSSQPRLLGPWVGPNCPGKGPKIAINCDFCIAKIGNKLPIFGPRNRKRFLGKFFVGLDFWALAGPKMEPKIGLKGRFLDKNSR